MILAVLAYVRELKDSAASARGGDYTRGFRDAVDDVEEYMTDLMWENGIDDPEDD